MFWRRKKDNSESETKTTEDVEGNTEKETKTTEDVEGNTEKETKTTEDVEDNTDNETTEEKVVNDAENSETKSNDNKESVSIPCDKEENENEVPPTKISYTGCVYDIDNVIDAGGFGKYQWMVTFLSGMIWFAAASQIMILTLIGDLIACTWNIYRSQSALLFSVVFFCMSIGSPIFGYIGDNYGRKKSIGLYLLIQFSFGAGSAAANSIHTMIFLMAFVGLSLGGEGQIIAYVCEFYPVKDRGIAGFYTAYFWTAATLFLLFICWGVIGVEENWRGILFIAALPALINLLFIKWYPESPRYFLVSEQPEKATKRLEEMASMNKVKMPEGRLKPYKKDRSEESGHFLDLFKPERRWSTVLKCFLWFSTTFTYYAYALITPMIIKNGTIHFSKEMLVTTIAADNSSGVLMNIFPCNQFTSQNYKDLSWITSSEFLGIFIFPIVMMYIKRITLLKCACVLTTLITFLLLIVNKLDVVFGLLFLGRANICAIYQTVFIITMDSFPTSMRGFALGTCSGFGRLGAVLVPFVIQVLMKHSFIATICTIGFVILFGSVAAILLSFVGEESTDSNRLDH